MIACIIEYGVKKGREAQHEAALVPLLAKVENLKGFISKEIFEGPAGDGRLLTVSYWENRDALSAWVADADHRRAMELGKQEIFAYFRIQIAEVEREYSWRADGGADRPPGA